MKTKTREKKITADKFGRLRWDPALKERKTTTDYLASALRTAIYDGQFADGEELNQVELAKYFNVSRVPIREALRQLQAEGLVRIMAHKNGRAGLTLMKFSKLSRCGRCWSAPSGPQVGAAIDSSRCAACAAVRRCHRMTDYGSNWVIKNSEFHRMLYHADDSATMMETGGTPTPQGRTLRPGRQRKTAGEAAAEHRQILDRIEKKDYIRGRLPYDVTY